MTSQLGRPLRVRCMTYNLNRGRADEDLRKLVFDEELKDEGQLADIYVIGFQEIAGLHLTFPSRTGPAIQGRHQSMLQVFTTGLKGLTAVVNKSEHLTYNLLASPAHGGLGLLVYARSDTVFPHIKNIQTATASCGFFNLMNNKGAVGVRLSLEQPDADVNESNPSAQQESFTFVNAHLTAHDSGLLARNRDFQTIISRLVFQDPHGHHTIYDTSHLFFMGDLNYRISLAPLTKPDSEPISKQALRDMIRESRHSSLFPDHETLSHQHACKNVLVGLREAAITFKPTYKYKRNQPEEFVSFDHRLPGWTDRIFVGSCLDPQSATNRPGGMKVVKYESVAEYSGSDHKPVFAVIELSCEQPSTVNYGSLTHRPLITIDHQRRQKQIIGFLCDQTCGIFLLSAVLAGFGNMTMGFTNLALLTAGLGWKFLRASS